MKMITNFFLTAKDDEDGAVTVDWVVLTAGLVVFGSVVVSTFGPTLQSGGHVISNTIISATQQ